MPNITFSLDKDLLRSVKIIAAKYDTSLNALVRNIFMKGLSWQKIIGPGL